MSERNGEDGTASTCNESKGGVAVIPMASEDNRQGADPSTNNEGEHESTRTLEADDARGTALSPVMSYEPGTDHVEPVTSEGKVKYEGKSRGRSTLIQCNSCGLTC